MVLLPFAVRVLQVLRYFDYVFTGVFTFEMVIKVKASREKLGSRVWMGHGSALPQCCHLPANDRPQASGDSSSGLRSLMKSVMTKLHGTAWLCGSV